MGGRTSRSTKESKARWWFNVIHRTLAALGKKSSHLHRSRLASTQHLTSVQRQSPQLPAIAQQFASVCRRSAFFESCRLLTA
jgi:hypothetical protein